MRYRFYGLLAVPVIFGAMFGGFYLDLSLNYVPVAGMITSTSVLCHLQKGRDKVADKVTHKTIEVPCAIAQDAVRPGQTWAGFTVTPVTTIYYGYVSPVDKAWHTGSTTRAGGADKWPAPGTHVRIYAHKKQADTAKFVT